MAKKPDNCHKNRESVIKEIEKALLEINLAESAFQWAQNNQKEVDLAIMRKRAAVEYFDFLIKKAKEMEVKLEKNQLLSKVIMKGVKL